MVHVPAKFTAMPRRVTVRKRNVTDGQTDGRTDWRAGAFQYLPSRAFDVAGDNKYIASAKNTIIDNDVLS